VKEQMQEFEEQEEWEFEGNSEILYNMIQIGNNFVVPTIEGNAEGVDFYSLQCQRPKHMVSEFFSCVWGCEFEVGDYVVAQTYYRKWGKSNQSYVYLEHSNITYIDAHLVQVIKFPMTPQDHQVKGDDPIYKLF